MIATDTAPPTPARRDVERVLFGGGDDRRFTQDTPVLPEVWIAYATEPLRAHDLIMIPHRDATAGGVAFELRARLAAFHEGERKARTARGLAARPRGRARLVHLPGTVAAALELDELVRLVLPATGWWRARAAEYHMIEDDPEERFPEPRPRVIARLGEALWRFGLLGPVPAGKRACNGEGAMPTDLLRLVRLVGTIALRRGIEARRAGLGDADPHDGDGLNEAFLADPIGALAADGGPSDAQARMGRDQARALRIAAAFTELYADWPRFEPSEQAFVHRINLNRPAAGSIERSVMATKGDAARRLFEVSARGVRWAVIDCGIDAGHPAFADGSGGSRVERTYDFSQVRDLLDPTSEAFAAEAREGETAPGEAQARQIARLKERINSAQDIDWAVLEPFVTRADPEPPAHEHGTHVAGIIGARWSGRGNGSPDLLGMCPDIRLIDCRVLDPATGLSNEFEVIAALQFLRYLNLRAGEVVVHGANLSISLPHDVENYACGRTPICVECEHAVAAGIVVVAAAGNYGYRSEPDERGRGIYRPSSITDPGNAEAVITVGSTHRHKPHQYGVSYFSGRGPTGDGRRKPDLVAPGEKIMGPLPGERVGWRDGTSMAAPHVSGAAALLMARHGELVGQPARVKRILCESATDLGRYSHYQGAGMLDVLRALQSV